MQTTKYQIVGTLSEKTLQCGLSLGNAMRHVEFSIDETLLREYPGSTIKTRWEVGQTARRPGEHTFAYRVTLGQFGSEFTAAVVLPERD